MGKARILLVEDDAKQRRLFDLNFGEIYSVTAVDRAEVGLSEAASHSFHAIVLDLRLPGMDGLAFIEQARSRGLAAPIVVTTAFGTIDSAVQAMKLGAYDYVTKPFKLDAIRHVLDRAVAKARLEEENRNLRAQVAKRFGAATLVGEHPAFRRVVERALQVADTDVAVLLQGESGTGKELMARLIHAHSSRVAGPFVTLNCTAIPDELLESELFGFEKGAFTGATRMKPGKLEAADGGTLLLDEIGEMKPSLQVKLLRVLEEREVTRLGDTTPRPVDVRVIAASNQCLLEQIETKRFRQDLYFRLNVAELRLPALRERREDLPLLIAHFLRKHGHDEVWRVDDAAMAALRSYGYPGNVRELENALQGAMVFARERCIRMEDLPSAFAATPVAVTLPSVPETNSEFRAAEARLRADAVRELEIAFVRRALAGAEGNVSEAARRTHMPRRQFYRLLERHGLAPRRLTPTDNETA